MAVSADEVRHIATLARLTIDESRIPAMAKELDGILRHMEVLRDTADGVDAPVPEPLHSSAWRPDHPVPSTPRSAIEEIAPAMRDGFFLVPRLATHEAPSGDTAESRSA